ncbi:MAG: ABC transporter permease subunit [Roseburia sp.]|jgi:ABC-2 type transport system permease protein|nr:ABC transporter permease subunit [Roseburia sp.]
MILPLFKRDITACVRMFLVLFAVICMYTVIIIYLFDPEFAHILNDYQELLPDMMAAMGMVGAAATLLEWIQVYLYGFIMLLLPLVFAVILMQKLINGYVDSGTMANLLATPNSRRRIIRTQAFAAVFWMAVMMGAVTLVGAVSSELLFPGELDLKGYLLLNAGTFLVQLLICGITFAAACVCSESRQYYLFGAGIPVLFFLIQAVANMGEKLDWLKYLTIFTLLPTAEIVQGEGGIWPEFLIMGVCAAALFGCGSIWFEKRELYV